MTIPARDTGRGECLAPTAPRLLGNPLGFIHEDHLRARALCAEMDRIAAAPSPDPAAAARVAEFLTQELPLHLADEESDLFPLLRRRCPPDDEIAGVLHRLHADHAQMRTDRRKVVIGLHALADAGVVPDADTRTALGAYANRARRHLILENAIILPFARLRLIASDHDTLRLRMMQRRGLDRLLAQDGDT